MAPKGLVWPRVTDAKGTQRPAHFIGQIDCAAIPEFGLRHLYPRDGILFFFYPLLQNGFQNLVGDLVVHLPKSDEIQQIVPDAALPAYKFNRTAYQKFWLHELEHTHLPPGSILPKWEMDMGVSLQWGSHTLYQGDGIKFPPHVEEAVIDDDHKSLFHFCEDFEKKMARDPSTTFIPFADTIFRHTLEKVDGVMIGFEGFPHNYHAIHTMLGLYRDILDSTTKALNRFIAFVDEGAETYTGNEAWCAPQNQPARKVQSLKTLSAIAQRREAVTRKMTKLSKINLAAPTREADRKIFWQYWKKLSSEGALKLETHHSSSHARYENGLHEMNRLVEEAALHCSLASACHSRESFATLPKKPAKNWIATHQPHPPFQRYLHQSLGHAPSTQNNEEEPLFALPLMQFPDVEFRDFQVSDLGALQYWIDLPDLERHDFSKARAEIGN